MSLFYDKDSETFIFPCPHCEDLIQVGLREINCSIFRHGYYYLNNNNQIILLSQINPHESKEVCDRLKSENKIVGCGKPFRLYRDNNEYKVAVCDYV